MGCLSQLIQHPLNDKITEIKKTDYWLLRIKDSLGTGQK